MSSAVNKISGLLLRLVLTMSLVILLSPVMASAMHTETDLPTLDHCIESTTHSLTESSNNISQNKTAETIAESCQDGCCPDGDCPCDVGCVQSTASSSSSTFIMHNVNSLQSEDNSFSYNSFNTRAASFNYSPALHPPIS